MSKNGSLDVGIHVKDEENLPAWFCRFLGDQTREGHAQGLWVPWKARNTQQIKVITITWTPLDIQQFNLNILLKEQTDARILSFKIQYVRVLFLNS